MVFYYFFKKIILNRTPDIPLLLLGVRGECQHVVQTRLVGSAGQGLHFTVTLSPGT